MDYTDPWKREIQDNEEIKHFWDFPYCQSCYQNYNYIMEKKLVLTQEEQFYCKFYSDINFVFPLWVKVVVYRIRKKEDA